MARGSSHPMGKLTREIKVRVSEATAEGLERLANDVGMGLSEAIREILDVRVHGRAVVLNLHKDRLLSVIGIGPDEGD